MVVVNKLRNNFSSIERRNSLAGMDSIFCGKRSGEGDIDSTPDEICYSVDNREGSNRVKLIL